LSANSVSKERKEGSGALTSSTTLKSGMGKSILMVLHENKPNIRKKTMLIDFIFWV
jgi:hypothetical protein